MSSERARTKIAKGIYRDQWGYAVIVNVGTLRRERRFPPLTELKTLKEQRDEMRVALRKVAPTATRGTFAADAQRYLRAVAALPTIKEREKHIALWSAEFGTGRGTRSSRTRSPRCSADGGWRASQPRPLTIDGPR